MQFLSSIIKNVAKQFSPSYKKFVRYSKRYFFFIIELKLMIKKSNWSGEWTGEITTTIDMNYEEKMCH